MPIKDAPQRCPSKKPLKDVPQWCPSMMPFKDAHPFQHRQTALAIKEVRITFPYQNIVKLAEKAHLAVDDQLSILGLDLPLVLAVGRIITLCSQRGLFTISKHCQRHNGPRVQHLNLSYLSSKRECHLHWLKTRPTCNAISIGSKFCHHVAIFALVTNLATRWHHLHQLQIWPPDGATYFSCKFSHQMAPLALVANLATRWHHLHQLDPTAVQPLVNLSLINLL